MATTSVSSAVLLALASALGYGAGFALTPFGLRWVPPWLGAAFSLPTSTLLFWCLAPFLLDPAQADGTAAALFAAVGLMFPATVTLLNFISNRAMGPNVAGAVGATAPVFAVLLAVTLLGETIRAPQALGVAAIVGGIMLMYRGQGRAAAPWSLWMLSMPVAAAVIRGAVQPIIKLGLERWPDPLAAVVIGYTVSSAVMIVAALVRQGGVPAAVDRRAARAGALWFAAVGICNGLAVLSMYAALGRGPVVVVSPVVASYPLVTLVLSLVLLRHERIGAPLVAGVAVTVGGVILLLVT